MSPELRARLEALPQNERHALTTALKQVVAKGFNLDLDENDIHTILDALTAPKPFTQLELCEAMTLGEVRAWLEWRASGLPFNPAHYNIPAIVDRVLERRAREAANPSSDEYTPSP